MKTVALFCLFSAAALGAEARSYAKLPQVPVGITASSDGRVFVSFSRAIDPAVTLSVAELVDGKPQPFPPGFEQGDGKPAANRLLSVQSLVVDANDRLWLLDTGKVGMKPVEPGSAKLVAYDLKKNEVVENIAFDPAIAGTGSFLNDLRVDVRRNVVYLTDASPDGPNGIVVLDLAKGTAKRRLENHASTRPDPAVQLQVEGRKLVQTKSPQTGMPFNVGADGIALSPDGEWLYYSPLTSHRLYRVRAEALIQGGDARPDDLGDKGFAADGMLMDGEGRLYSTDFEHGAVKRRNEDGSWETLASGGALSWPDTLALLPNGELLVTATQIHRSDRFRAKDERVKPFQVLSIDTGAKPRVGRVETKDTLGVTRR